MNAQIQYAKTLGTIAFANGLPAIPYMDKDLQRLFVGRSVSDKRTMPELMSWIAGWNESNLS